jgi:uncharacterized protein YdeI (YjbR/CyaY-like superfamily)
MAEQQERPTLSFASQGEWEAWLEAHHTGSPGIWLKLAKKASGVPSVTYPEAVESALCFGWIDGLKRPLDDAWWLQKFTPRGKQSVWSRINAEKVEQLIQAGRMRPAGLAHVEAAKQDGRMAQAYAPQSQASMPDDLQRELAARPAANAFFAGLNKANRYAILYRLQHAKRPETRARRLAQFVAMLEAGETLYP